MEEYIFNNPYPTFDNTGTFRNPRRKPKRNEPCPCGSGFKFKKCCGVNKVMELEKPLSKEKENV